MDKPTGSRRLAHRGVALVEALVALLILGLSALSLSGVQSLLWLNGETARQREHALLVATQQLEALRMQARTVYDQVDSLPQADTQTDAAGTAYALTQTVVAGEHLPYKTVSVVVRWNDRSGRPQDVVLGTVVSRPTPHAPG
ncbi:type IV pilus modification PilV family protein [Hydrogenophaga defluvii]|uniref:Type IV pilus assembly protein PilV n=1 Tax=Hydrogenophaga defluvii TaxID=249410 RepID=A0ABW2SDM5_9BURK